MTYIWHNSSTRRYELGDEASYNLEKAIYEVTLLYDFAKSESVMAKKILTNLNRAARSLETEAA